MIGPTDDEKASSGIVLTAPIARFTKVTASEDSISLFSNGSLTGFFSPKYILYSPDETKANPMYSLLSPPIRINPEVKMTFRNVSIASQYQQREL